MLASQICPNDPVFGFAFADFKPPEHKPEEDEFIQLVTRLRAGQSLPDAEIHPADLFADISEPTQVRKTVYAWLEDITVCEDNHFTVGSTSYPFRKMVPKPFYAAMRSLALSQGWALAYLENPSTRLREYEEEAHTRGAGISAFAGLSASDRKSSLVKYISRDMINVEHVPPEVREGRTTCNDGTLRGFRDTLTEHKRAGVISDEVSNTYLTSFSEQQTKTGVHYMQRSKMCTFCSQERDSFSAGSGRLDSENYAWTHVVHGQREATSEALRPTFGGFQKRFMICFPQSALDGDPDIVPDGPRQLLALLTESVAIQGQEERQFFLDPRARTLFRAVQAGVRDYLNDTETILCPFWIQKIKLWDTDMLKFCSVCKRMCQALRGADDFHREAASVFEIAYAIHTWRRQLALHRGYYRWASEKWPLEKMSAAPQPARKEPLPHKLFIQQEARDLLRHKLNYRECNDVTGAMGQAFEEMVEKGLLTKHAAAVQEQQDGRKKKRKLDNFKRVAWSVIRQDAALAEYCANILHINIDEQE
ncbi:unnamed protein product [Effrenium voratum]|nr:unnamed protein product [Effrenium voratum]CAJ1444372.1 unnamed protein product [Effrenium voratum]